jgi:hypothetical protein
MKGNKRMTTPESANEGKPAPSFWFPLFFTTISGLFVLFLTYRTTLECQYTQLDLVDCDLRATLFGVIPLSSKSVTGLQQAIVDESCDDDCTYQVQLQTGSGMIPLTPFHSSGSDRKQRTAQEINDYLAGPTQDKLSIVTLEAADAGLFSLIPLLFLGMGLFLLFKEIQKKVDQKTGDEI